jgi:diguanylate cyclase
LKSRKCEERERVMGQSAVPGSASALYDSSTSLPTRVALYDRLKRMLALTKRRQRSVVVLFVDLDGFREINDRAGHDVGDRVLREVARRLKETARASDQVARVGGDEFVVVAGALTGAAGQAPSPPN